MDLRPVLPSRVRSNLRLNNRALEQELERATIARAEEVPDNLVTMNSRVRRRPRQRSCVCLPDRISERC
jgi:transcription elongation GreA/GreB family factor